MKTVTILKSKDLKQIYKFEPMEEPIVYCDTTYAYIESVIFDGIVVCQRMIEQDNIDFEICLACTDITSYEKTYCA